MNKEGVNDLLVGTLVTDNPLRHQNATSKVDLSYLDVRKKVVNSPLKSRGLITKTTVRAYY